MSTAALFLPGATADSAPRPDDVCVAVAGRRLLLRPDGPLVRVRDLTGDAGAGVGGIAAGADGSEWTPLGTIDGVPLWSVGLTSTVEDLGEWRGWPTIAARFGEPYASVAGRALQVVTWRRSHRFCGACAAELADVPGEHARRCPACELYVPMQLSPAVLVAVTRHALDGRPDELLLVRHASGPTDLWALVAGFVEAGESLEDAARREVAEEVRLRLVDLRYFGSQPWAMSGPGVVLAGFHADCADPKAEPVADGSELTDARWFPIDALPADLPPAYSMSRWLIDAAAGRPYPSGGRRRPALPVR